MILKLFEPVLKESKYEHFSSDDNSAEVLYVERSGFLYRISRLLDVVILTVTKGETLEEAIEFDREVALDDSRMYENVVFSTFVFYN